MFTGIIEAQGEVVEVKKNGSNLDLIIESSISHELKVDQSLAHNGVCLTVTKIEGNRHFVTAVDETLKKTNLGQLKIKGFCNLERCMKSEGRFDGHVVYGHVDSTISCTDVLKKEGSYLYNFNFDSQFADLLVEKGSACLNGISLTVFNVTNNSFNVEIIPFTFEHTNIQYVGVGDSINIEFDILGKYVKRIHSLK